MAEKFYSEGGAGDVPLEEMRGESSNVRRFYDALRAGTALEEEQGLMWFIEATGAHFNAKHPFPWPKFEFNAPLFSDRWLRAYNTVQPRFIGLITG